MQRRRKRRAMRKHRRAVSIQRDNEETPRNSMTQQRTRERRTMPTPSPVASIGIRLAYNRYTQHPCWNRTLFPSITFRFKYTRRHASKFIPIRRLIESLLRIPRKDCIRPSISALTRASILFVRKNPRVTFRVAPLQLNEIRNFPSAPYPSVYNFFRGESKVQIGFYPIIVKSRTSLFHKIITSPENSRLIQTDWSVRGIRRRRRREKKRGEKKEVYRGEKRKKESRERGGDIAGVSRFTYYGRGNPIRPDYPLESTATAGSTTYVCIGACMRRGKSIPWSASAAPPPMRLSPETPCASRITATLGPPPLCARISPNRGRGMCR